MLLLPAPTMTDAQKEIERELRKKLDEYLKSRRKLEEDILTLRRHFLNDGDDESPLPVFTEALECRIFALRTGIKFHFEKACSLGMQNYGIVKETAQTLGEY